MNKIEYPGEKFMRFQNIEGMEDLMNEYTKLYDKALKLSAENSRLADRVADLVMELRNEQEDK